MREVGFLLSTTGSAQNSIRVPSSSNDEAEALDVADGPTSLLKREPTITASRVRVSPGGPGSRPSATKGPALGSKLSPDSQKPVLPTVKPKEEADSRPGVDGGEGEGKDDSSETTANGGHAAGELGAKPERPPRRAKRTQDDVDEEKPGQNEEPMVRENYDS